MIEMSAIMNCVDWETFFLSLKLGHQMKLLVLHREREALNKVHDLT